MFNLIFKGHVQARKHLGVAIAEPEIFGTEIPNKANQNKKKSHQNPNNNFYDGIELYQGISKIKGTHNEAQQRNNAQPKNSAINCVTVSQCHMVTISIYR